MRQGDSSAGSSTQTSQQTEISSENESSDFSASGNTDILVVYFSWSGNTREMADYISEKTGGDLLELQPGATVIENGLSVSRNNVPDAESEVISWLEELGFNQQ